jgi:hypothetical protein
MRFDIDFVVGGDAVAQKQLKPFISETIYYYLNQLLLELDRD